MRWLDGTPTLGRAHSGKKDDSSKLIKVVSCRQNCISVNTARNLPDGPFQRLLLPVPFSRSPPIKRKQIESTRRQYESYWPWLMALLGVLSGASLLGSLCAFWLLSRRRRCAQAVGARPRRLFFNAAVHIHTNLLSAYSCESFVDPNSEVNCSCQRQK